MTYELAKKLKDAGFPKDSWCGGVETEGEDQGSCDCPDMPTLSELIKACGVRFGCLGRDWRDETGRFWCAIDRGHEENIPPRIECTGKTPEEAVANLWLALNQ